MHMTEDVSGTLRAQEHGAKPLILANQQSRAYIGEGVCPTITATARTSGNHQPVLFENHGIVFQEISSTDRKKTEGTALAVNRISAIR